jgi:hypothetical protein
MPPLPALGHGPTPRRGRHPRRAARALSLLPIRTAARVLTLLLAVTAALGLPARPAAAQLVGSEPSRSPYRDLETTQQVTVALGWFAAASDAAGVGPRPAPFALLRHDLHLGGPAWLTSRYALVRSEREVIDPGFPAGERSLGRQPATHHLADVGITMALTGRKSWRGVVPTIGGGIGLTSDFGSLDLGNYRFGTKFAFTLGPGLRVVLPRGYALRLDLTNHVYQFRYPDTYFARASDSTSVLTDTRQRSGWLSNWGATVGTSVPLFRR